MSRRVLFPRASRSSARGFTLIEMIVVTFLLLVAMLALLAVFDASARINKSETDVADAQGAVRYGIYQMTRVIRMAGAGGLFVTQAVLSQKDPGLLGITIGGGGVSYNNVQAGTSILDGLGNQVRVRPGTDMIEVRGVILSPLLGFDQQTGCNAGCTSSGDTITILPTAGDLIIGEHVNDDAARRPQFAAIDAYTASVTGPNSMLVIVEDGNTDLHVGCSDPNPQGVQRFPQPLYNVGVLRTKTTLTTITTPRVFGTVDFAATRGQRFNSELPSNGIAEPATPIVKPRRVGVLDDIIFFVALLPTTGPGADPNGLHPFLAQGVRRGDHFEVTALADDVEDLQIAYGVDQNDDGAVGRRAGNPVTGTLDIDPNVSMQLEGDEWRPNVVGEPRWIDDEFQSQGPFVPGHPGVPPTAHCPRLRGVMVSLMAKAHDPDPTYKGPAAKGYLIMDSTATPITGNFRRRVQTLKINLRNYQFQG
jgi:prepilin-type N-terminal cleavage/methylation domain-containing protein